MEVSKEDKFYSYCCFKETTKESGQDKDTKRSLAILPQQEEMQQQEQYHLQLSQYQQQQQQIFYRQHQHLLQPYSF